MSKRANALWLYIDATQERGDHLIYNNIVFKAQTKPLPS